MDYTGLDIRGIRSADACEALASDLEGLAKAYRSRAKDIRGHRSNALCFDDKWPVIKAARLALIAVNKGVSPATACRNVSNDLWVSQSAVALYLGRLMTNQARDRLKLRNGRIRQQSASGAKLATLSRRYGLSKGQISKIIKHKNGTG